MKNDGLTKKTLGVLGVFAGVGLLSAAMTYQERSEIINAGERASELNARLLAATQCNNLLRDLNNGKEDQVKSQLKSALAYNLKAAVELAPGTENPHKAFAVDVVARIERQEKLHADRFLASRQNDSTQALANR